MNEKALLEWFKLTQDNKKNIFSEVARETNLPPAAVEKDWWVVRTLEQVFSTEIGPHTVFKGGTSLSKAWNLIKRFSEDIDLALDRSFLGFNKEMNNSQVSKLRKSSFKFISEDFFPCIQEKFKDAGFNDVEVKVRETTTTDQDPLIIEVNYESVVEQSEYLSSRILIEIGSRSLTEPYTNKNICSFVGEHFKGKDFADTCITIPTVNPERTFLEKIFLLHEEFQQSAEKIKVDRLSRHLYDLEKIMDTEYGIKALEDKELYQHIVAHRRMITPLRGIDYANHIPTKINIIPSEKFLTEWEKDYKLMKESMFYAESLSFNDLMDRIAELNTRINRVNFD
jgi:predicted nucleotidyltransferase component of viral defense system